MTSFSSCWLAPGDLAHPIRRVSRLARVTSGRPRPAGQASPGPRQQHGSCGGGHEQHRVDDHGQLHRGHERPSASDPTQVATFSHHLRILREAGVLTKRIQGARGYTTLRKADLDRRFPGLIDSIVDAATEPVPQPR
jgi:DNA-binding transcriptional ArsR family regulator